MDYGRSEWVEILSLEQLSNKSDIPCASCRAFRVVAYDTVTVREEVQIVNTVLSVFLIIGSKRR